MDNIVVDEQIENGEWPQEFNGAWVAVCHDAITTDTVASLFFDDIHNSGDIIEWEYIDISMRLPDAYVSWREDGVCREIFVSKDYRRRGIGSKLCAWARSYTVLNSENIFSPPQKMTLEAQMMYRSLSNNYGEPYNDPEDFPPTIPYSYWGGYLV